VSFYKAVESWLCVKWEIAEVADHILAGCEQGGRSRVITSGTRGITCLESLITVVLSMEARERLFPHVP
jgi:hypothetical protein